MSTADHATCCCADTLAEVARLTAERDRARALAIRLEAEAAQPYLPAGPFPLPHRDPTPIIEWAASVGLDAKGIPADGVRIIGRTPLGGCLLLVQSFEVAADGKRVILADGSGFARTAPRHFEVTTLPPEPWLTEWSAPPAEVGAAQMPGAVPREGQEGAGSAPSRAADGWSPRDLADELLTLQPVDPARCNPRRKIHPVIGGRELECGECWRVRVVERLEQLCRSIEGQEGAESGPSRVADGLAGSDRHSGTPATEEARKSAESDADDDGQEDDR